MKKSTHERQQTVFIATLVIFVALVIGLSSYLIRFQQHLQSRSEAEEVLTLQSDSLASNSSYTDEAGVAFFNMTSGDVNNKLYSLKSDQQQDVISFLAQDPQFEVTPGTITSLIPDSPENLRLVRTIDDRQETYLLSNDEHISATHYYFEQMRCGNIPVFGANVGVHTSNGNSIYALSGALIKKDVDCSQNINEVEAQTVATNQFKEDLPSETEPNIIVSRMYIFSPGLVDVLTPENKDYLTQYVELCNDTEVCRGYFVDKKSGTIVFSMQTSTDALNRRVVSGSTTRTEQSGVSGNAKVDQTFDILGSTYNYFNTTLQRDSFNGSGGTIIAEVPNCSNNASWNGANITVCSQLVASDVISHEFQHAVTQYAVGGQSLIYQNESGALNESLSDVFAMALDPANWTMGETTALGAIRDLAQPSRKGHPNRMFSGLGGSAQEDGGTKYYCSSGDSGGVHINSGVFNHAFYLMIEGGAYNGCTVTGLGKENMSKAHLVVYRALTTYLQGKNTANFRDMYDAVVQACNDIHTAGSAECAIITAAMQAVEMDQQTTGKSKSPACTGGTPKPATCIGGTQPVPTGGTPPAGSPTPETSGAPTQAPTTPVPTSGQTKTSSPLRSSVSAPQSATGDVELEYDGSVYKLTSTISEAAFSSFFSGVQGFAGVPLRGELVGVDRIDTGRFTYEDGKYTNRFSSGKDLTKYSSYQVVAINETGDEIPFLLGDLGAASEGSSGSPKSPDVITLDLSVRLQGIEKKPNATQAVLIRVGVGSDSLEQTTYKSVFFTPGEGGIWTGKVDFDASENIAEGDNYKILIKGPKHIQRKLCENNPKEEHPGLYKCTVNTVQLKKGVNVLDFSGVIMLAGDLPPKQDGIVNSRDVLAVREKLSKNDFEALAIADVNYDGVVNAVDDALVIYTLANRTDE